MTTAKTQAKRLNAHHAKTCAGFYGSNGGRYFMARATKDDRLEVSPDFGETWIDASSMDFGDHNGHRVYHKNVAD